MALPDYLGGEPMNPFTLNADLLRGFGQFVPAKPEEGMKNDSTKAIRPELLPVEALEEISKVFAFGSKKYADNNWRKGFAWMRLMGSLLRHLYAWARGEDLDSESGISHLAHAGCNVLFLLQFVLTKAGTDDRIKPTGF